MFSEFVKKKKFSILQSLSKVRSQFCYNFVFRMSDTVIRMIERRGEGDKMILIAGMVGTLIFMVIVIRLFT